MGSPRSRGTAPTSKRAAIEASVMRATEALLADGAAYPDLPVEQIATRAGISRTAFYFYFRDKRELLMRMTEGVAEQLFAHAESWWDGTDDGDGAAELSEALAAIFAIYREHAPLLRAVVEAAAYDPPFAQAWRLLVARFVTTTRERIEREQAAGNVDPALPAAEVAFGLAWMTERSAYELLVQDTGFSDEALVQGLLAIWLGAVYGRPA
jgi:TetR/AcrR family transcriptional regulator, ethionamide resistance regulator